MSNISYRRHRFPPEIIQHAVWLYFRFPLSYRNVEDLRKHPAKAAGVAMSSCRLPKMRAARLSRCGEASA